MLHKPPTSTLFPYTTLFRSYPLTRRLELVAPETYVAKLKEPQIPEDKDSGDPGQLPTYNAYSADGDRKSTRLNSSHMSISYAVFCLKKKKPSLAGRSIAVWI